MPKTVVVIDGNSLAHRAFYALPPMKTSQGTQTNAVYGFLTMLFTVVEQYAPEYLAVAFDRKEKTFRHRMFEDYKAGRRKTPDELISQFPLLKDTLQTLGVSTLELAGYEADDILGTVAAQAEEQGYTTYLVTGDRDALQLVDDHTAVLITKKGVSELEMFDRAHLREVYALEPAQIVHLKSLMGDASDHIPGVPGVGEKTALKLLAQYPTLETLYAHIDDLPANKLREKLVANRASAELSKTLATIDTHVPLAGSLEDVAFAGFAPDALAKALSNLEFYSLLKRMHVQPARPQAAVHELQDEQALAAYAVSLAGCGQLALAMDDEALWLAAKGQDEARVGFSLSLFEQGMSQTGVLYALAHVLQDEAIKKTLHNAKAFMHACAEQGIVLAGLEFDTAVAAYVLSPTRRNYALEKLCEQYGEPGHAAALFPIREAQEKQICEQELERIFYEIEMPLIEVLFSMEQEGFAVNTQELVRLQERYGARIEALTREIHALAGGAFNIASTKQLGEVLFVQLGLPAVKKKKTGFSTDIEVLEKLADAHPIVNKVIEYRQLTKLKSTYIDGLLAAADAQGKVHTTFNQLATATGRISSQEPNLQNIPVRSDISWEIRQAFVPARPENTIVSADYSQIELRVLAHIANDARMQDAFLHDEDIHTRTAAEVFGVPQSQVTPEMRSSAKAVNFGIVYGISDFGLAKNLGIPRFKAAEYIDKYLMEFSGVDAYMKRIVREAKETGCVRTLFGRVRAIDELSAANYNTRAFGERAAMNTPIQGTAADIIKYAMICVSRRMRELGLMSRLILQVHDELIVDAVPGEVETVKRVLREEMEAACALRVPLKVNISSGRTWAEAK